MSLAAGWLAFDEAERAGDTSRAHRVAREVVDVARLRTKGGQPAANAAERELSVSLNKLGDAARAHGRLEEAEQVYREGLGLARQVLSARGETPGVLRDVSVFLNKVGDVARELGRLEEAEQAYREGLELARWVLAGRGSASSFPSTRSTPTA